MKDKTKKQIKLIALVILLVAVALSFSEISGIYKNVEKIIGSSGNVAPFVYILLMIFAILISPIPASPLAILGGTFFGPFLGMLYTLIGATTGAVLAFLLARFFLRGYISRKLEKNKFYQKIKGKKDKNIAKIIFITRLMPHVSFDIVSYAAGLTNLSVPTFAFVTFVGMVPIVFMLSFFGSLVQPYLPIILVVIGIFFILYLLHLVLRKNKN